MSLSILRLLLTAGLLCSLALGAEAKTFKLATLMPDGSDWLTEMRAAGDQIKERTGGRVKLKFYPGGVMGNDKTVMRKVRAGQLHGGAFTSGAMAAVYPDIELYSLPLLFRGYDEVDYVRERMDDKLITGLDEKGWVALSISDGGFAYVLSQKPMRRVEDLPGAKIWIVEDDVMSEIAFELAGVSPIPLAIADVYTSLQSGLIDTVAAPPMGAIAFQWHTKVNYLTNVPIMYLTGILAIDKKAFVKISPEDQQVVREEVAAAGARLDAGSRAGDANAKDALQNQGIEFVEVSSEEELERWRHISAEATVKLREKGRYSDATMTEILDLLEQFRAASSGAE
jgi:TRAP-type C4-dicarboxylate transport system substrate-binding protein